MKLKLNAIIRKPELIFIILGSFFGLLSMFIMPVLTIPDEGAHFWASYSMFSKNKQIPGDLLVSAEDSVKFIKDKTYIEKIFLKKVNFAGDRFQLNIPRIITINKANVDRSVSSLDIARLPQAIGILVGKKIYPSVGVMTTFGRLFNLILFLAAIYVIIKKVKYGKLAFVFLALFPMMIHQAASLSYDVANIVIIFAWVAFMINLSVQKSTITRNQMLKLVLLGIIISATKPTNMILFGLLPFLPTNLYKNTKFFIYIKDKIPKVTISKRTIWAIAGTMSAIILIIATYLFNVYLVKHGVNIGTFSKVFFNTFFRTDINTQLDPIVTTGIVGHFGWLWYKLPEWLVFIHLSVFGIILLGEKAPKISLRFAIASGLLLIASILFITIGMYFLWTLQPFVAGKGAEFIQGMQGRYFTPLLILLIPSFVYTQQYVSVKIDQKLLHIIAITMSAFSLIIYLILTYTFFY